MSHSQITLIGVTSGLSLLGFVISFTLCGHLVKWSPLIGWVDRPRDRRMHKHSMPNSGGVGIAFSLLVTLVALYFSPLSTEFESFPTSLFLGFLSISTLGLIDDHYEISPIIRLMGYLFISAGVVWYQGSENYTSFTLTSFLSFGIHTAWFLFLINAFNLIDGIDGLSSLTAFLSILALGLIQLQISSNYTSVFLCLICASSILGFIPWNFPKAKIFLGNSGSTALGFLVAYLSSLDNTRSSLLPALVLPLICVAYPLLDLALVATNRLLRGQHPFSGDRSHLHHRFNRLTGSSTKSLILLATIHGLSCFQAILLAPYFQSSFIRILALTTVNFGAFLFILLLLEKSVRKQVVNLRSHTQEGSRFAFIQPLPANSKHATFEEGSRYRECKIDFGPMLDAVLFEEKDRAMSLLTSLEELIRANSRDKDLFFRGRSSGEFILMLHESPNPVNEEKVKERLEDLLSWFFLRYKVKGPHSKLYKVTIDAPPKLKLQKLGS